MDTINEWVVINYSNCIKQDRLLTFLQALVNTGRVYWFTISKPLDIIISTICQPEQDFPALVAKCPNLQMIICVLPEHNIGLHDQIKIYCDTFCNIVIECVMEKSVQRQHQLTLNNILINIGSRVRNHAMQRKEILKNMKTETKSEPENMKTEIKSEPENIKAEIKSEPENIKVEIKSEPKNIKAEIKSENMKMEIKSELENIKAEIKSSFPPEISVKVKEEPLYSEEDHQSKEDKYDYKPHIKKKLKESQDELSLPIPKHAKDLSDYDDLPLASRKKGKGIITKKVVIPKKTVSVTSTFSIKEPIGGTNTVSPKDPVVGTTSQLQDVTEEKEELDEPFIDLMMNSGSLAISDIDKRMKSFFSRGNIPVPSRELMIQKLTNRYNRHNDEFNSLILKINQQVKIKDARIYKEKGENFFKNKEYTKAFNQFKKIMDLQMDEKKKNSLKVLLEQMKNLRYLLIKSKKLYTETDDRSIMNKRYDSFSRCGCWSGCEH